MKLHYIAEVLTVYEKGPIFGEVNHSRESLNINDEELQTLRQVPTTRLEIESHEELRANSVTKHSQD